MSNNSTTTCREEFYLQDAEDGRNEEDDSRYTSFAEFFKGKLKLLSREEGKKISTREFAERFGTTYNYFRRIVNQQFSTKKRDCIIAVCTMLKVDAASTNCALRLYGLPELNDYHKRDEIIWGLLADIRENPVTIDDLNAALTAKNFEPLDVIKHREGQETAKKELPYKPVRKYSQCTIEGIGRSAEKDSFLDLLYDTECFYNIRACMEYYGDGKRFELCIRFEEPRTEQTDNIWQTGIRRRIHPRQKKYIVYRYPTKKISSEVREHDNISDTGEFREYFLDIEKTVQTEHQRLRDTVNDTRNYSSRIGARVVGNELHIFCEMYNCDVPELGEYYLMDFCGGEYSLYILDRSCFMQMYLPPEEYERIYGMPAAFPIFNMHMEWNQEIRTKAAKLKDPVTDSYCSEEDIGDAAYEARNVGAFENYGDNAMTELRIKAYKKMKSEIRSMKGKLKTGKAHICSYELLGERADEMISEYFGLSGGECAVSPDDLRDAFELGLRSAEEAARFLEANGTLKLSEILKKRR